MEAGPQIIVTPFDPDFPEAIQGSGIPPEQQPLVSETTEAEMIALRHLSFSPPTLLPLHQPMTPELVGLSDKELARLRAEALTSQQSINRSTSNEPRPTSSSNSVTGSGGATSPFDTQRLHSEVESLRREMEQLRSEGLAVAAPPSYTEGDV